MSALVIYLLRESQILDNAKPVASVEGWVDPGFEGVCEPTSQPPYHWLAENEILAFMRSGNGIHGYRTRIKEGKAHRDEQGKAPHLRLELFIPRFHLPRSETPSVAI